MDWSDWKEWMTLPLKRYFEFTGRSRRKEFWMWALGVFAVTIVLTTIDSILGFRSSTFATGYGGSVSGNGGLLSNLFALAIFIPNLAVSVRRLHDTDRSGWWVLLMLPFYGLTLLLFVTALLGMWGLALFFLGLAVIVVPLGVLCAIVLLVFCCLEGTRGPNRYGPDPKGAEGAMGGQALH